MLFTFFQWIWLILIVVGAVLFVLRPIGMRRHKTVPVTDRMKAVLWFLQSLGFWAIVIGSWMRIEALIDAMDDDDEEAATEKD
jgi:branched-subunit amino acid transport protein